MTRVAVDALGGDNAPGEVILGALDAAADGIDVVLYGPAGLDTQGLPLVETTEVIEMADKPAEAVRAKPDSSLVAAVRAVADGRRRRGRLGREHRRDARGRAAASPPAARRDAARDRRPDPGARKARASCSTPARTPTRAPSTSLQFAHMGAVFSRGDPRRARTPRCACSRSARRTRRGTSSTLEAHQLLRDDDGLNFKGNAESRDLLRGAADVVVTDGFTGNIALKLLEGTIKELLDALREEITATADRQARRRC